MTKIALPPPKELERICKGLATLDALLCEEWESRYYSFDRSWSTKAKQRMASMRNGSGDEWFLVFAPAGAFFKAFWHEHPAVDPAVVYEGIPRSLAAHVDEPAFSPTDITLGGWYSTAWTLRGNAKPLADELAMLQGDARSYRRYASDYFEVDIDLAAVRHVLAGKPLDAELVASITSDRTFASMKRDLAGIGYGA